LPYRSSSWGYRGLQGEDDTTVVSGKAAPRYRDAQLSTLQQSARPDWVRTRSFE
jgi:hypothetical protein